MHCKPGRSGKQGSAMQKTRPDMERRNELRGENSHGDADMYSNGWAAT